MTESKTTTAAKNEVRAGASVEEEKAIRKEAREDADNEAVAEAPDSDPVAGLVKELPDNAFVAGRTGTFDDPSRELTVTPTALRVGEATAPTFADEFHGQGGSFVIDPETGDRKRQYIEQFDAKGKSIGFIPAP